MKTNKRIILNMLLALALVVSLLPLAPPTRTAQAVSTNIVISEFRTRGPNGGSDEFIELYNLGTSAVNIGGWKIRGSNSAGSVSTRVTITAGTVLNPGCHFLATNSSISGGPYSGAVPGNQTYTTGITDDGGIAITTPSDVVVDAVGMSAGSAFKEDGTLAPLTTNVNRSYERKPGGSAGSTQDTDANTADFQLISPSDPQNLSSACVVIVNPTGVGTATPNTVVAGGSTLLTVAVTPGTNPTSTGLAVTGDLSTIGGSPTQPFFDDGTNGDVTAGDNVFSYLATNVTPTACGASLSVTITDAQSRQGSATIALTVQQPAAIHDIQGASHVSSLEGKCVRDVSGIVTAKRSNGFYMQDPNADSNDATSEGIFVFTSSAPTVTVGDAVRVSGTVQEFRPGGTTSTNLTTTEIGSPGRTVAVLSSGNPLPAPVVIGTGGRIPPSTVIEDDATGDVETSGTFDPASDGIDFYESLEGMLVQVNNAVAVGPWHDFGTNREIPVVGDNGANASVRTTRGGVVIQLTDFNPERIILNDLITGGPTLPPVNVSDSFPGATVGVMDYSFGNFKLEVTQLPAVVSGSLAQEVTTPAGTNQLAVATFNVENLDPGDGSTKFNTLASLIVNNLRSPDIVAVEEIQDNNGPTNDPVVDATTTYNMLITAIDAACGSGCPYTYQFRQINPVDDADGGEPGGNIRQGFLFRTDRGLSFIDRPGAGSTTANAVVGSGAGTQLQYSPGRIDPTNSAFSTSRKPLAGEFMFRGLHLFVIANHFNSKGGDQPLFGHLQPPTRSSEVQRHQQAQIVHDFVDAIETADPSADVVVLGDLNDFQFSNTLSILTGTLLRTLMDTLPVSEQYSYDFDGNSQAIDHILLSSNMFNSGLYEYDVVHVNSEFAAQASDHEPQVVRWQTYNFTGFFQPVDNLPTFNVVKAGQAVPVKFSLGGFKGLGIFDTGYPQSMRFDCDSSDPQDAVEETVTAGGSSLSYDATTDQYNYVWKTNKAWGNTCRQLLVKLNDGTFHRANFKFTK